MPAAAFAAISSSFFLLYSSLCCCRITLLAGVPDASLPFSSSFSSACPITSALVRLRRFIVLSLSSSSLIALQIDSCTCSVSSVRVGCWLSPSSLSSSSSKSSPPPNGRLGLIGRRFDHSSKFATYSGGSKSIHGCTLSPSIVMYTVVRWLCFAAPLFAVWMWTAGIVSKRPEPTTMSIWRDLAMKNHTHIWCLTEIAPFMALALMPTNLHCPTSSFHFSMLSSSNILNRWGASLANC